MFSNFNNQGITDSKQIEEQNSPIITEKFLPEDALIIMIWFVKEPSKLKYDQLPLPDNKDYPYKDKILNCAGREAQREIRLYANLADLTLEQRQKMNDLMDVSKGGRSNIKVIDFNAEFKDKYDLKFLKDGKIPFAWKIDIARLIPLIEDGSAIYFDFDTLPQEEKIGKIAMNDIGYKMGLFRQIGLARLENSIIVAGSKNNFIVLAVYNVAQYAIGDHKMVKDNTNDYSFILYLHETAMTLVYNEMHNSKNIELEKLEIGLKEWLNEKKVEPINYEGQHNCFKYEGARSFGQDGSWSFSHDKLYKQEKSSSINKKDLENNSALEETIAQNVSINDEKRI